MKRKYIAPQSAEYALCTEDIMDIFNGSGASVHDGSSGKEIEKVDVDNTSHADDDWGSVEID